MIRVHTVWDCKPLFGRKRSSWTPLSKRRQQVKSQGPAGTRWRKLKSSSARAPSCAWAKAGVADIQVVSTRSLGIDVALGVGGLPRGRVVEIYGPESSGKTTLTLVVIAEMQKRRRHLRLHRRRARARRAYARKSWA